MLLLLATLNMPEEKAPLMCPKKFDLFYDLESPKRPTLNTVFPHNKVLTELAYHGRESRPGQHCDKHTTEHSKYR